MFVAVDHVVSRTNAAVSLRPLPTRQSVTGVAPHPLAELGTIAARWEPRRSRRRATHVP